VTIVPAKRDHKLTGKLLGERDGILAWAIEGCMAWQKSGLKPPSSVVEATKEYFSEEDALQEFEDSEIVQDPQSQVPIKDIYSCWKRFAESRGLYVGSARWLTEQLTLKGYRRVRLTGGIRGIRGVRLQAKSDDWLPYKDT
jgi:putative DNA primase/helicase